MNNICCKMTGAGMGGFFIAFIDQTISLEAIEVFKR
jgi:mevalonate kinase